MNEPLPFRHPLSRDHIEALRAAVRPEYAEAILLTPRDHPVFTQGPCPMPGCRNNQYGSRRLCPAHYQRHSIYRRTGGKLSIQEWIKDPGAGANAVLRQPEMCDIDLCELGCVGAGLCWRHFRQWDRDGRPEVDRWRSQIIFDPGTEAGRPRCAIAFCQVLTSGNKPICHGHYQSHLMRRRQGREETIEGFIWMVDHRGTPRLDLRGLSEVLRLEVQYAVQAWGDQERSNTRIDDWTPVTTLLAQSCARTILDRSEQEWRADYARARPKHTSPGVFLSWLHEVVDVLINGAGWHTEYDKDIWRLGRLGRPEARLLIRHDRVQVDWLRALGKRWLRHRISAGLSAGTVAHSANMLARTSTALLALGEACPQSASAMTRWHVEHVLASGIDGKPKSRHRLTTLLNTFLTDVHRFEWATDMPSSVQVYREDYPRVPESEPRAVDEYLMKQIERTENIVQIRNPADRLVVELMINCGLRSGDALRLELDCIVRNDGQPYLRYLNRKLKRTAFVPLDEELARKINEQQGRAIDRFPHLNPVLFPRKNTNVSGQFSMDSGAWRTRVYKWLATIEVHDEQGRPVHITPHQYRHTFGTRLINLDVDQHTVQRLLDHASPDMTAHYARLRNAKLREGWEKARKINIEGREVLLGEDHPLAEASWLRAGVARAKQTLPNGYCGMPAQSPCDHANPCLTCPLFLTTPEFLPQHRDQRRRTLNLIEVAKTNGHDRVVEKNQEVARNIDRIIAACEGCSAGEIVAGGKVQTEHQQLGENLTEEGAKSDAG